MRDEMGAGGPAGMSDVSDLSDLPDEPGVLPLPAGKEVADEAAAAQPHGK